MGVMAEALQAYLDGWNGAIVTAALMGCAALFQALKTNDRLRDLEEHLNHLEDDPADDVVNTFRDDLLDGSGDTCGCCTKSYMDALHSDRHPTDSQTGRGDDEVPPVG